MKIAILGGSFNPPHLGHLSVAKQVLDFTDNNQVWLTPCYKHTFLKNLVSVSHRVKMTKLLTNRKIKYCHQEITNKLSGETIELMEILRKKHPHHQFSFIIGSDNLKSLKKWGNFQKLIQNYQILVFPRPRFGFSLKKYGLNIKNHQIKVLKSPLLIHSNISSTNIRKRIKKNLSISHLLPQKIKEYIEKHQLYK
ncbi:nicotinate (nicotinamide) nucleotide adenylyltransferase [Candidatus Beckwithbacteria bacterium CG10_big_fil_rev_8_21_14_0_10_34_10]|uniref:Probable nicotinate-nucleotide adenylyltransferase n=1 Tax=Candidatus Beckwithbacteria bacterium CG10_big_fil_rev_8_21_14_0_10_34_10 TaxID=1974495 RepID=A0A2H0W8Q1_9BACT|nr:MAG: nicotinate (nicotinamide) nucleotide adenylyltransferase [Candidatus Beckwithbacteria bacterium CG10_big_fil_rev_8_21_14_0_10_34_10]